MLSELKPKWDAMTDAQRTALGDTIAGVNQYKVLTSVMQNFDTAIEANETAITSQGSAMRENDKYMESFDAHVNNLTARWQDFSNNVVNNDFTKLLLDIGKVLLEIANTDLGQIVTQIVLLSSVGWGASSLLKTTKLVGNITKQFSAFSSVLHAVTVGSMSFSAALTSIGGAAQISLPLIMGIVAVATVLAKVITEIVKSEKQLAYSKTLEGRVETFNKTTEKIDELQSKYSEAKNRLDELNATPFKNRTSDMQAEIEKLTVLVEAYEALLHQETDKQLEDAAKVSATALEDGFDSAFKAVRTTYANKRVLSEDEWSEIMSGSYQSAENAIISIYAKLVKLGKGDAGLYQNFVFATEGTEEYDKALNALKADLADFNIKVDGVSTSTKELASQFRELAKGATGTVSYGLLTFDTTRFLQLKKSYINVYNAETLLLENGRDLEDQALDTRASYESMATVYYMLQNNTQDYSKQVSGLSKELGVSEDHARDLIQENTILANSFKQLSQNVADVNLANATVGIIKYIDLIDKATNAKSKFDEMISSGGMDYSSGYEGYADIYSQMQQYLNKGQIGGEFQAGASLLFDEATYQEFITAMETDLPRAMEIAQSTMGRLAPLFNDADNAGLGFLNTIKQMSANGTLLGATYQEVDGQTTITVDNLDALSSSLGVSTSGVFSAIQAWKDYGINANITSSELLGYLSDIGVSVNDNVVDMDQVVSKMRELGATDNDIMNLQTLLKDMDGVTLENPVSSMDDLQQESDDTSNAADAVTSSLQNINNVSFSSVRTKMSLLRGDLDSTAKQAGITRDAIASISSGEIGENARGTRNAPGGLSLVNEEGPEIIEEDGKQRIASNGQPTLTYLKKGATVYTAKETAKKIGLTASVSTSSSYINTLLNNYNNGSGTASTASPAYDYSSSYTSTGHSLSSNNTSSSSNDAWKNEFDEWLKWKDHQLAMDQITEQQYYDELNKMNEKYFANRVEYLEDYWKYQEQIYKWQKDKEKDLLNRQLDDLKELEDAINDKYDAQIDALEKENEQLNDRLQYEELLENLAKAQSNRVMVYKDGKFQYVSGQQDLYDAQAALDEYNRNKEIEAQKEAIEKLREHELAEIVKQEEEINNRLEQLSDNKGYADGSLGVRGGLSLVGENGPEFRVLNKGDGIIPNDATSNLMRWANQSPMGFKSDVLGNLKNIGNNVIQHFENITLPNVNDITSFISEMKRISTYAYQF